MSPLVTSDPSYPAYPVLSALGFVLVLIPLPWHLQAWNSGTCLYMMWTALGCLNLFINSIVWHGNAIDHAPIWCDISSRLIVGIAVAIPAASLCINRRLYNIATVQTVSLSRAHKRRAVMVDLAIGLGIPIVQMALQYIVEGHRYDIFGDIGCRPALFNTPPAYLLTILWPTVIGLTSGVYCVLTLRAFFIRRAEFSQFVASNSSLTVNRYFRLMGLATVEILFNTPLSAYGIYLNIVNNPIQPWLGWADAHFNYSAVDLIPALEWRRSAPTALSLELSRWSMVFCAFLFFGFFGFAEEARKHYRLMFWAIAKRCGLSPTKTVIGSKHKQPKVTMADSSLVGSLPIYVPDSFDRIKHDSFDTTLLASSTTKSDGSLYSPSVAPDFKVEAYYPSPSYPPSPTSS